MKRFLLILALLIAPVLPAFAATIYVDTGGCQTASTTKCSGTTDSASATVSGAAATITCSAVAGPSTGIGCSLSGTPALTGFATDGSQAIYVDCATNSTQKIFFINAVDDALDLVGTTVAPTGCTAAVSDWGIGGRMIYNSAYIESAVRPGDTITFNNSPASKTGSAFFTVRVAGTTTGGYINFRGTAGSRPALTITDTNNVFAGSGNDRWYVTNLEFIQQGASGDVATGSAFTIFDNVKVSDGGGNGVSANESGISVINSEVSGVTSSGISSGQATTTVYNNYIHDNGVNGIILSATNTTSFVSRNIIDTNAGRGLLLSGASTGVSQNIIVGNTIYTNGNSGLEITDADNTVQMYNNIFMNNGDAANEYNVEQVSGTLELAGIHSYNDFNTAAAGGSGNVFGMTINSTEITTNPSFVDAPNGNFSLGSGSPAKATGYPGTMLGGTNVGYLDMGALQAQATAGGGTHGLIIGQ